MNSTIPIIPQNDKNNFIFYRNNTNISIEILIKWNEDIFMENLYLIIISIIKDKKTPIIFAYVSGSNGIDEINIFHNIKINKIIHMSYIDFTYWFEELYSYDERYLESFKYYAIGFSFEKESFAWINKEIYPIYPWKDEFKNCFLPKYNLITKIKKQEKELKKYKIKLFRLKKQLKKHL